MHKDNQNFNRPKDQIEVENRETKGLWKAIAYAKDYGEGNKEIDLDLITELNRMILIETRPEAAGKFRVAGHDIEFLTCITPPPGSEVYGLMLNFEKELKTRLSLIEFWHKDYKGNKYKKWVDSVIDLAAWIQHRLVYIHPFCEGNGRTARLMTNVILCRYHFRPTNVKIEAEDKDKYLNALCQIDNARDYRPLKNLIIKGSIETLKNEIKRKNINLNPQK